jgi:hypothetical protein
MRDFQIEFVERSKHVRRYLAVVSRVELEQKNRQIQKVSEDRLNVLRAGTFLILYNLIEAAARTAVAAIHDEMKVKAVPFAELRRSIRREVIKGFKRRGDPDTHQDMTDVPLELVTAALDVEDHFSGNVDARRFRDIAKVYGFSDSTDKKRTHDGAPLLTIKNIRNDLAHGLKTFEEVGRNYPIKLLLDISIRSGAYTSGLLGNIASYLDAEEFRESKVAPVAA